MIIIYLLKITKSNLFEYNLKNLDKHIVFVFHINLLKNYFIYIKNSCSNENYDI